MTKEKLKLMKITDVIIDDDAYPRMGTDWVNTARYINALKSGAVFPPITVAELDKKYILVDGAHRLKAHEANGETHIQTEVLKGLDMRGIYREAIKRNSQHGRQFSTQEVTQICITLQEWGTSLIEISKIVRIPADKIVPFVAKRMTRILGTGEDIALKASLKHLANVDFQDPINQNTLSGAGQVNILISLIKLIKNNWLNTDDKKIMAKIKTLKKLLEKY